MAMLYASTTDEDTSFCWGGPGKQKQAQANAIAGNTNKHMFKNVYCVPRSGTVGPFPKISRKQAQNSNTSSAAQYTRLCRALLNTHYHGHRRQHNEGAAFFWFQYCARPSWQLHIHAHGAEYPSAKRHPLIRDIMLARRAPNIVANCERFMVVSRLLRWDRLTYFCLLF